MSALLTEARRGFHRQLVEDRTLMLDEAGIASNADGSQRTSREIAAFIARGLGARQGPKKLPGQQAGRQFEVAVQSFLEQTFPLMQSLRPGKWHVENVGGQRGEYHLARYEPYSHLDELARAIEKSPTLISVLGNSYEISPDVLITREPETDEVINRQLELVDRFSARHAVIRRANQDRAIVHAVVSCKWTLRSDRAQNARSEALNLIRNRKGRTPHIAVVTGEPSPSRLASLALGTGDLDVIYHFALPELIDGVEATGNDEGISMLGHLVHGKRLRDIADLPLDLAV